MFAYTNVYNYRCCYLKFYDSQFDFVLLWDLKFLSLKCKMAIFKIKYSFPGKKTQQDSQELNLVMTAEIIPDIN